MSKLSVNSDDSDSSLNSLEESINFIDESVEEYNNEQKRSKAKLNVGFIDLEDEPESLISTVDINNDPELANNFEVIDRTITNLDFAKEDNDSTAVQDNSFVTIDEARADDLNVEQILTSDEDADNSVISSIEETAATYNSTHALIEEPTPKVKQFRNQSDYSKLRESFMNRFSDKIPAEYEFNKYFRVTSKSITILLPQEPWPKDVLLFQHYEVEQILLPDNANCLAVQTFLKMCQLDYKVEARPNADAMSPTNKIPFIKCGAFIVSELEGIVQFVGSKGISLTSDLDSESKADMRAYMTLVNNVLGSAELYLCWCENETYNEVTKPRFGSVYPWPLNHIQTWAKRQEEVKRLKVIGWSQKSLEEVYNDVETCCQALTDRLDNNQYFFGSKPTELEALIFGHLYTILTTPLPNANLANIVKNYPKLIDLITRIEKQYFQRESFKN